MANCGSPSGCDEYEKPETRKAMVVNCKMRKFEFQVFRIFQFFYFVVHNIMKLQHPNLHTTSSALSNVRSPSLSPIRCVGWWHYHCCRSVATSMNCCGSSCLFCVCFATFVGDSVTLRLGCCSTNDCNLFKHEKIVFLASAIIRFFDLETSSSSSPRVSFGFCFKIFCLFFYTRGVPDECLQVRRGPMPSMPQPSSCLTYSHMRPMPRWQHGSRGQRHVNKIPGTSYDTASHNQILIIKYVLG